MGELEQQKLGQLVGYRGIRSTLDQPPFERIGEFCASKNTQPQRPYVPVHLLQQGIHQLFLARWLPFAALPVGLRTGGKKVVRELVARIRGDLGIETFSPHGVGIDINQNLENLTGSQGSVPSVFGDWIHIARGWRAKHEAKAPHRSAAIIGTGAIGNFSRVAMLTTLLAAASMTGWIGTYTTSNGTSTGSPGIYAFQWDTQQGLMRGIHPVGTTSNPSFLALHPNGRFLYAVNEDGSSSGTDHITTFAVGDAQSPESLRAIGTVSSHGVGPCHLGIDAGGKWLFVANYDSGTIAVFPIQSDGRLGQARQVIQQKGSGPIAPNQESAHAHEVVLSPDERFLLSADLGADKIFVYGFEASTGALTPNAKQAVVLPAGYGPRHLVFSKDGRTIYVVTELTPAVVTFRWNAQQGSMTQLGATSTLPAADPAEHEGAEIALHPNGKFLYASNRGHSNTIAIFRIDHEGLPVPAGHVSTDGTTPRFFNIDPTGKFLIVANQGSGDLVTFAIDPSSGALTRVGPKVSVPAPVSFVFARRTHPR